MGDDFFGWELKTPCIKIVNMNLKIKKMILIIISTVSLLVPYPNKFLVVCFSILIFYGIYSPLPPICKAQCTDTCWAMAYGHKTQSFRKTGSQQRCQDKQKPCLRSFCIGGPNFLFGRGGLDHFLP